MTYALMALATVVWVALVRALGTMFFGEDDETI